MFSHVYEAVWISQTVKQNAVYIVFLNEGAATSNFIKLVCVIVRAHYSPTEVSHLENPSPCLQPFSFHIASHFKPHRGSPKPK